MGFFSYWYELYLGNKAYITNIPFLIFSTLA